MPLRTARPRMLLALTGAAASVLLASCSLAGASQTGSTAEPAHSHSAAADAIAALPGIAGAEVSTSTEGTPNQVLLQARVSADAGYAPSPAALLDYVLQQAWAITETKPTTTVRVDLTVTGQDLDLVALADELGLEGTVDADNKYDASLRIPVDAVESAYGDWPGVIPAVPAELTDAAG
jgi:hypothetical protein